MFPTVKPLKQTPTSRMRVCVCRRGFMWVHVTLHVNVFVSGCAYASCSRPLKWVWAVCTERGRGLVLLNDPAPTVWPWGPCAYYLMTLCPEWETDPLWVRLWRKEEQFQCVLLSDNSAQHTALEVSPVSPRPLRTTKFPTCRLETSAVCMFSVFVCTLRDWKEEKQWKCMFPRTLSNPLRKYF